MRPFDELLQEELARVEEPVHELVVHAPALYRLMANILDDPSLPGRLRPLVLGTVAYFVLSTDIMSESLRGIDGYADDVFLTAFVANRVLQETGSETALTENWDGDVPLLPLLTEILAREIELIGDRRDLILWYIGYEYTQPGSAG